MKVFKVHNSFSFLLSLLVTLLFFQLFVQAQEHPKLILTKDGVAKIKSNLGSIPLFDKTLAQIKTEVDLEIENGIQVPIPKDFSGGYTHERHKRNFFILQKAGVLFQILDDEKYARYIRDMLFEYEKKYQDLPVHPQERSYARGKLFWQCLNDSNWLVYVSQAYDCIYDWLSKKERKQLEKNLFRPFADFISIENPQFFNRVHNHSTWGNAAVGMIGLVMNDEELVQRALYGIKDANLKTGTKDNDGGFITVKGQEVGFFANLEEPFSPDGYYTEGPYYQRYASYPFLIFAQALHNVKPELKVFQYKDSVLLKSVNALLNLTDTDGEFFPINDAQKGMSYFSRSLVSAVDIAYYYGGKNPELLSIAEKQQRVVLDETGLSIALDLQNNIARPFIKKSINFSDGLDGKQGGLSILRQPSGGFALLFKYTAQGLSHGHYDKLSYLLYEDGEEVLQDYGLARFVNIEQKGGGNYLKENKTWAKQTVAHNTLVQDKTSHFGGAYEVGSKHHSELHFVDFSKEAIQIVSAKEENAYPGTNLQRTLAIIKDDNLKNGFILDIYKVDANDAHQYDLPFYYKGQIIDTNFEYDIPSSLTPLGKENGYQHLWLEGKGNLTLENTKLSWLNNQKFYSLTLATKTNDELLFTRIGANDPEFNLRRDAGFMLRRENVANDVFAAVIESHGSYSPVSELAENTNSIIKNLRVAANGEDYTAVIIENSTGDKHLLIVSNKTSSGQLEHTLEIDKYIYKWIGPYYYGKIKK
ncbi:MAG: heparinase II/III family protein [Bacteroidota bacterium]